MQQTQKNKKQSEKMNRNNNVQQQQNIQQNESLIQKSKINIKPQQDQKISQQSQHQDYEQFHQNQEILSSSLTFCSICCDFIVHSVTTLCEHTFCELCLNEYMIYLDQCPQCSSRIRNQKLTNNITLDTLIIEYIKKYQPDQIKPYQQRVQQWKNYQKQKKVKESDMIAGARIDVRDLDYVWCTARIYRTLNKLQEKKTKFLIVKYDLSNKKQQLPENSPRIAPLGFYTQRNDIPKYEKGKLVLENPQENIIYTIPNFYQHEKEVQQCKEEKSQNKQKVKVQQK